MRMQLQCLVVLLGLCCLISACGAGNRPDSTNNNTSTKQDSAITPIPQTPQVIQTPQATPAPTPTAVPTANPEKEKPYQMNKNYFIVPKDPNGNKKVVLLTFDDGPKEKEMIDQLISILDKHKAKAIFFVNGYRVKKHPELLKLIYDSGQIIGNHSWDHIDLRKESNDTISSQIKDVQKIVQETIGVAPTFFRPPFGSGNDYLKDLVKQEKMLYMTWSNGSLDWDPKYKNKPVEIIQSVLDQLKQGKNNILMHELPWTISALDSMLQQIAEQGYSFLDPNDLDLQVKPD